MSARVKFIAFSLLSVFFSILGPSFTYAAALPGTVSGTAVNVSSSSVSLSFSGTSGTRYHVFLEVNLPIDVNPSLLTFGTPATRRSITEYDFISYSGNVLTCDFFYLSDGNTYTYELRGVDSSIDLSSSSVISYGFVYVDVASISGSTMFIYDKYLAVKQWTNTSHYLSDISSTYAISTTSGQVEDTDTHYSLSGSTSSAVTSINSLNGQLWSSYGTFVNRVSMDSDSDISSGLGPTVRSYNVLTDAQLTGGLRSTTGFDILLDEWGQYMDRVGVIPSIRLSSPLVQYYTLGDIYMPLQSSISLTPNGGFLYTNSLNITYITIVIDIDARPYSVSVDGCTLRTWSYSGGRLVLECYKENQSGTNQINLNSITLNLNDLRSNFPLMKISGLSVGTFDVPAMIGNMDEQQKKNIISRGFDSIRASLNNLLSGLTTGFNSDTSEELNSFDAQAAALDAKTTEYVQAEDQLTNSVGSYVTGFSPSFAGTPGGITAAFGLVSALTDDMYDNSGAFKYVVSFTLTLGCVLFVLGLRRR